MQSECLKWTIFLRKYVNVIMHTGSYNIAHVCLVNEKLLKHSDHCHYLLSYPSHQASLLL